MRQSKRALRRHHLKRIKTKWLKKVKARGQVTYASGNSEEKYVGMLARTPQMCSCYGCSGSRRHHGKTLKEIRFDLSLNEGLEELIAAEELKVA